MKKYIHAFIFLILKIFLFYFYKFQIRITLFFAEINKLKEQKILTFSLEQYINNNLINSNIENALNNLLDISFNDKGINNNNDRCIICFENLKENEKIKMTKCFHLFHYLCIKKWIIIKSESPDCPICRRKL